MMIPEVMRNRTQKLKKNGGITIANGFHKTLPDDWIGKTGQSCQATVGRVVRAGGAEAPDMRWKNMRSPKLALQPPSLPELLDPWVASGAHRGAGGVGKKMGDTIEDGFTVDGVGYGQKFLDGNGPGEGGKGFAIFRKAETFGQADPNRLLEAEGSDAGLGERASETESVPASLLKDFFEFFWG